MEYRKNASRGDWCTFLLPFCFLPFIIKYGSNTYLYLFNVCICSSVSWVFCEKVHPHMDLHARNYFNLTLQLVLSFTLHSVFKYNLFSVFAVCLLAFLYHGYLVSSLLRSCPGSFTFGELQIIAQGVILFLISGPFSFLAKMVANGVELQAYTKPNILIIQVLMTGTLLFIHVLFEFPFFRSGIFFIFSSLVTAIYMMIVTSLMLKDNIFIWMLHFCTYDSKRISLLVLWILLVLASVLYVRFFNKFSNHKATTIERKIFHLVIILVYVPGIMYDINLLMLASGIAFTIFLLFELLRVLDIPLIGEVLQESLDIFLDSKDSGKLILSHIYLLVGCSCPLWLYHRKRAFHVSMLSGILSVGFGDSAAAIGGTLFGKHRWKGSTKTYEGSFCALLAQLIPSLLFLYFGHDFSLRNAALVFLSAICTTVVEAKTTQVDNLVLPLCMFSILAWI